MNPYSLPMHGEPKTTDLRQVDFQWSAATTVYRFFVGGIPFQNGIAVSTEHGNESSANAMYSSVAYFYSRAGALEKLDEVAAEDVIAEAGATRFTLVAPEEYSHFRLRRRYRPGERQEAEVWVNGRRAGVWYASDENPYESDVESDFLLPSWSRSRDSEIDFEIRFVSEDWSAIRYELWGIP